jgi:hypothetical protein
LPVQSVPSVTSERTALLGSICNFNKASLRRTVTATSTNSPHQGRLLPWTSLKYTHLYIYEKYFTKVLHGSFILSVKCNFTQFYNTVRKFCVCFLLLIDVLVCVRAKDFILQRFILLQNSLP